MKRMLAGLLMYAAGFSASAWSGETEKYHGVEVREAHSIPGYESRSSGCVEIEQGGKTCEFAWDEGDLNVGASKTIRVLFLMSNTGKTNLSSPVWKIEDSLSIADSEKGSFELMDCGLRVLPRIRVAAFRVYRKAEGTAHLVGQIEKVWRMDGLKRKFIEIPLQDAVCGLFDTKGI